MILQLTRKIKNYTQNSYPLLAYSPDFTPLECQPFYPLAVYVMGNTTVIKQYKGLNTCHFTELECALSQQYFPTHASLATVLQCIRHPIQKVEKQDMLLILFCFSSRLSL
jgi:hypothetical protein